jgi:hypothetical protein
MKLKRLPGVFGLGIMVDDFTDSAVICFLRFCWKITWPKVGRCRHCGHHALDHKARRDHGFIEWTCKPGCECTDFSPVRKGNQ